MIQLNWPLIIVLFSLALPGVFIAIPRLVNFLLHKAQASMQKRVNRIAVIQSLLMIFVMTMAGSVLSRITGLGAPVIQTFLDSGDLGWPLLLDSLLPLFLFTAVGLFIFFAIYYGLLPSFLDKDTYQSMSQLRSAVGLDGSMLYSGIAEELIVRWGLVNLLVFFGILFIKAHHPMIVWIAILLSSVLYTFSQLPVYVAVGCAFNRRLIYALLLAYGWQGLLFGLIFWQYGILAAMIAHMLFHLGWWVYQKP